MRSEFRETSLLSLTTFLSLDTVRANVVVIFRFPDESLSARLFRGSSPPRLRNNPPCSSRVSRPILICSARTINPLCSPRSSSQSFAPLPVAQCYLICPLQFSLLPQTLSKISRAKSPCMAYGVVSVSSQSTRPSALSSPLSAAISVYQVQKLRPGWSPTRESLLAAVAS